MSLPKTPSLRVDRKRALVTGGTSGIGLAAAAALAEAGAHVTIISRGAEKLTATAQMFDEEGYSVATQAVDVSDVEAVRKFVATSDPFDILVNSAGLARNAPALDTTPKDFDAVLDINVRGAFFLTQAVAARLADAGKPGSLINISSQMGHVGGLERAVYSASKHALEGMTKSMAIEWGPKGIRINTLCPTFIRTPLTKPTFDNPELVSWLTSKIKMGRVGEVEDIMGAVVFLASDASSMVTGSALLVDGGWTAG